MTRKFLNKIVGQKLIKRELEFYLEGYERTGFWPPCIFSGSRGQGKSLIVKALAAELSAINRAKGIKNGKRFLPINSAELVGVDVLFDKVMPILVQESDIVLFLDESENLSSTVQSALLSLLAIDDKFQSKYFLPDGTCFEIDHTRFAFMGAASSFAGIHPDLLDRLKRFSLEDYNEEDLQEIMRRNLPHIDFEPEALDCLVSSLRNSPRHAVQRANDLKLMDIQKFSMKEFEKIRHALSIYPLGLNRAEIGLLRVLARGSATLTELSARLNLTRNAVMDDLEVFLKSKSLIKTAGVRGRVITQAGMNVLKQIDENYS